MAAVLWWPLSLWFSPAAAWFIFFNAVVGAIAVMSSSSAPHSDGRRLCRSGSSVVLDRLRSSFSIFAVHPLTAASSGVAVAPPLEDDGGCGGASSSDSHCYYCSSREAGEAAMAHLIAHGEQQAAAVTATSTPAPTENNHAAPGTPSPENDESKAEAEAEEEDESMSLDEAYALAQRHRAQEQASPPWPSPPLASAAAATTATAPAWTKKKAAKKVGDGMRRRRGEAEEAVEGKAELNARAELFIRQFREELKLQRLNSILSHTRALGSPTAAAR